MSVYFEVYASKDGWRWRLVAGNGKIIADSGEAYASKRNAKRAVRSIRTKVADGA